MQREIKFRGRRIDNREWVVGDLINCPNGQKRIVGYELKGEGGLDIDFDSFNYIVIPETVGQFTGFKDRNGVDCYDGDYDAEGNMIAFCNRCSSIEFHEVDIPSGDVIFCHKCEGNFLLDDHISDFEIIASIHD